MSRTGRPPKPSNLKVLQGTDRKDRINANEPKPKPLAPDIPSFLDAEAKEEWERIASELERLGLLTIIDGSALASYCYWWSVFVQASEELKAHVTEHKKQTMTYTNIKGASNEIPHPSINTMEKASKNMKAFATEFGLTPAARSRMTLPEEKEIDEFEEFLNRGRR